MKYLFVLAAVLMLAACGKDSEMEDAAEDTSSAMESSTEAMDADDATMADTVISMGSNIDDARGVAAELEKATMESNKAAEMKMEEAKHSMGP
jgi:uncharacterized lipoprotein YajG